VKLDSSHPKPLDETPPDSWDTPVFPESYDDHLSRRHSEAYRRAKDPPDLIDELHARAVAAGETPVQQLATCLGGWSLHRTYRYLKLGVIPGAHKVDPGAKKSRWHIPDPADSARRFHTGERGEKPSGPSTAK
jgi:hypothetical protein